MWVFIFNLSYKTNGLEFFHVFSAYSNFSFHFILSGEIKSNKRVCRGMINWALTIQALDTLICSCGNNRIRNITIWNLGVRWSKHSFGILKRILEHLTPLDFNLSSIISRLNYLYSFWTDFKLILRNECLILIKWSRCNISSLNFKEGINLILNSHKKFVWTCDSNINSRVFSNIRNLCW